MKRRSILITLLIVFLIFVIGVNIYRINSSNQIIQVKIIEAKERELTHSVITSGKLMMENEQFIAYDSTVGEISDILVETDDRVKKGDVILRYQSKKLLREKEQQDITIDSYYLQINQLKEQGDVLEAEIERLTKGSNEIKALKKELSQIELEKRLTNLELKKALLEKERIEEDLQLLEVKSEIDGQVIFVNSSSNKQNGDVLLHIGTTDRMLVKGEISQFDIGHIKEGQTVNIFSDAIADKQWEGNVMKVGYLPINYQQDDLAQDDRLESYPLYVRLDANEKNFKPGINMTMEVETENYEALTIPNSVIIQEKDHASVLVVDNGKVQKRIIETGTIHEKLVEVMDGLKQTDKIILKPGSRLVEGMEVKVK